MRKIPLNILPFGSIIIVILLSGVLLGGKLVSKINHNLYYFRFLSFPNVSPYRCLLMDQESCESVFSIIELVDRNLPVFNHAGLVQLTKGAFHYHKEEEGKAIEIWSETPTIGNYLMLVSLDIDTFDQKKQLIQYGTQLYPSVQGFFNLGVIYLQDKQYSKAEEAFSKALELSIDKGETTFRYRILINLGRTYFHLGEYEKSTRKYYQAAELKPERALPWIYLAESELAMGDAKSAINLLNKTRGKQGNETLLLYQLALAYYKTELFDDAIAVLNELIYQDDQHKGAWLILGNIYYKESNYEEAYSAYSEYLKLESSTNSAAIKNRLEEIEKIIRESK